MILFLVKKKCTEHFIIKLWAGDKDVWGVVLIIIFLLNPYSFVSLKKDVFLGIS